METDGSEWQARLAFRDFLRTHPETAAEYAALKRHLAALHEHDREAYTDSKSEFIRGVLALVDACRLES